MSKDDLLPGLMQLMKGAARTLVAAMACPGSTGPQRVQEITGHSLGIISRWQSDAYKDVMPLDVVFQLEFLSKTPVFARQLAALNQFNLAPMAEGEEVSGMVGELVRLTSNAARATTELAEGLKDGKLTYNEGTRVETALAPLETTLSDIRRKIAAIKAQGGEG